MPFSSSLVLVSDYRCALSFHLLLLVFSCQFCVLFVVPYILCVEICFSRSCVPLESSSFVCRLDSRVNRIVVMMG